MATELTTAPEPDEAFLIFRKKGSGGIADLRPGEQFVITNAEKPTQSIVAQVTTARDLVVKMREAPQTFYDFDTSFSEYSTQKLQRFSVQPADGSYLQLTQAILSEQIVPIVSALSAIQRILFGTDPIIRSITQNSPVNISMEGAGGLYEKVATDIIPWRRKRAKEIAALEAAKSLAHLEQQRAEVLAAEAKTQREIAECEAASERARQARAEANLKEVDLTRARFNLAVDMVNQMLPGPMNAEKMQMISQLMPELVRLTGTLEIAAVPDRATDFGPGYIAP